MYVIFIRIFFANVGQKLQTNQIEKFSKMESIKK